MLAEVRRFMRREGMPPPGPPLWVAVSGGIDSMVLLQVLRELGHVCLVAHVDHGLREAESDEDRRFVEEFAQANQLPFRSIRVDVKARAEGVSTQMAARELRYAWFSELLFEGPARLALGHHRDDAVESLLLNLLRGAGAHGWAGIQPVGDLPGGRLFRPLLCAGRAEIQAYADANRTPFREDSSNAAPKYLRNRVRHELLPFLEDLRPGARSTLARGTELLRELGAAAEERMAEVTADLRPGVDGILRIPIDRLEASKAPRLLLLRLLRDLDPHPDVVEQVLDAVHGRSVGAVFHIGGKRLTVDRTQVLVDSEAAGFPTYAVDVSKADHGVAGPFTWGRCDGSALPEFFDAGTAWLDLDRLEGPLVLRPWREGDRMRPSGLGGSKLVSDMLIDAKVPRNRKPGTYVLQCGDAIVWLVGHRLAEGVSAKPRSSRVLRVTAGNAAGIPS